MHGIFVKVISAFRVCLARLVTERDAVRGVEKLARAALLVPVFGMMLVLLRLRAWRGRPLEVQALETVASEVGLPSPT